MLYTSFISVATGDSCTISIFGNKRHKQTCKTTPRASNQPAPQNNSHVTQSSHMTAQSWSCDSHWFMLTVRNSGEFVPEPQTVEDGRSWEQQVSSHLLAEQGASSSGCRGSDSRCRSSGETHATVVYVCVCSRPGCGRKLSGSSYCCWHVSTRRRRGAARRFSAESLTV